MDPACFTAACLTAAQFSLASFHTMRRDPDTGSTNWCQANPGLLIERGRVVAGAFRSSLCKPAWILGWRQGLIKRGPVDLGVLLGVDHGYQHPYFVTLDVRVADRVDVYIAPMLDLHSGDPSGVEFGLTYRVRLAN